MMWKTKSNHKDKTEGHVFLMEETTIRNLYPEA